jgi:hypothetical protein
MRIEAIAVAAPVRDAGVEVGQMAAYDSRRKTVH